MKKMFAIAVTILPLIGGEVFSMIPSAPDMDNSKRLGQDEWRKFFAFRGDRIVWRNFESLGPPLFTLYKDVSMDIPITMVKDNWQKFFTPDGKTVIIPRNYEILASRCFSGCKNLSSVIFEPGSRLTNIGGGAFSESGLESVTIPKSVENLECGCFHDCESLSSVSFESESRLTRIEERAFARSALGPITIPESVEILGSGCFNDCKNLSSVIFESDSRLTRIESLAFAGSGLKSITVPKSVKFLGSGCFSRCNNLTYVELSPGFVLGGTGGEEYKLTHTQSLDDQLDQLDKLRRELGLNRNCLLVIME